MSLLGAKGLVGADGQPAEFPEIETALVDGDLGFRRSILAGIPGAELAYFF